MKKSILLILAIFAFSFAQAQGFKIGVKGGANYSALSGKDRDNSLPQYKGTSEYQWGWNAGLTALDEVNDFWGIRVDLLYTIKGYRFKGTEDLGNGNTRSVNSKNQFTYLSLPIAFTVRTGALYFELGPELAYLTKTKGDETTFPDNLQNFDFGYIAGIGYQGKIFGLGVRYNGDFLNISSNRDIRNSMFTASIDFMFGGHGGGNGGGGGGGNGSDYKAKSKVKP